MSNTIELYTGQTTNRNGSFMLQAYVRDEDKKEDIPLHLSVKDPKSPVTEPGGVVSVVPSSNATGVKGNWTKHRIECEDGALIKIWLRQSRANKLFGGLPSQNIGQFWLCARKTAPLIEIGLDVPTDHHSALSKAYITGRYDIVPIEEIGERKLYRNKGQNDIALFDPQQYSDIMHITELEGEISPKAKVVKKTEGDKTVTKLMRKRRIRVKRK